MNNCHFKVNGKAGCNTKTVPSENKPVSRVSVKSCSNILLHVSKQTPGQHYFNIELYSAYLAH